MSYHQEVYKLDHSSGLFIFRTRCQWSLKYQENKLPNAEFIGKNGFYIPIGNHISKKDQDYIIENVLESINAR